MNKTECIEFLWGILDDIDTYSDMFKNDNATYRKFVEAKQKQRWDSEIKCDGYKLDLSMLEDK